MIYIFGTTLRLLNLIITKCVCDGKTTRVHEIGWVEISNTKFHRQIKVVFTYFFLPIYNLFLLVQFLPVKEVLRIKKFFLPNTSFILLQFQAVKYVLRVKHPWVPIKHCFSLVDAMVGKAWKTNCSPTLLQLARKIFYTISKDPLHVDIKHTKSYKYKSDLGGQLSDMYIFF